MKRIQIGSQLWLKVSLVLYVFTLLYLYGHYSFGYDQILIVMEFVGLTNDLSFKLILVNFFLERIFHLKEVNLVGTLPIYLRSFAPPG